MLRRHLRSAAALAGLITLVGIVALPLSANAESTDRKLTVIVSRDVDANGNFSSDIDQPQSGIEIVVTDAGGRSARGVTGLDGRFVLTATPTLRGGRYFVVARIPAALPDLVPVPGSSTFQPLSTTVDLTSENQIVRMGVAVGRTHAEPAPPRATSVSRSSDRPELALFAVGDLAWRDDNRSGIQDPGESPASGISVQLLNVAGEVVASTVSGPTGRYMFDNLSAGTYSVRFAGVPEDFRLTPTGVGDRRVSDSDADYSGMTPPFTLGVGEPSVRPATPADRVAATYINPTIDAGITPLRYAVGDQVWLDVNNDGVRQPGEPAGSATVSLLAVAGNVVATTTTDPTGRYQFAGLRSGRYQLEFTGLPAYRTFTERATGTDPALDSDPDPVTGRTSVFTLAQGAPNLVPVADADTGSTDFENQTMNAGLVCAYSVGDTVWHDNNGNGVRDPDDAGVAGVTVQLLRSDLQVLASTVTSETGSYSFDHLPAGNFRIKFSQVPDGLIFTSRDAGDNPALDSDADQGGMTAVLALGNENPADTSIDAGVTTRASYRGQPGAGKAPVDAALSPTGGVTPQIPLAGAALAVAGASCLLVARRRRNP